MPNTHHSARRQHAIRLFILTYGSLVLVALLTMLYIAGGGGS